MDRITFTNYSSIIKIKEIVLKLICLLLNVETHFVSTDGWVSLDQFIPQRHIFLVFWGQEGSRMKINSFKSFTETLFPTWVDIPWFT